MSAKEVDALRELAASARRVAVTLTDQLARQGLLKHAAELEAKADAVEAATPVLLEGAAIPSGEPPIGPELVTALKPEPELDGSK